MKHPYDIGLAAVLLALAVVPSASSFAGPCRHHGTHDCFKMPATLDFSSVPDISNRIVANEPDTGAPKPPLDEQQPAARSYTGPTVGVANHLRAPEIGYSWSIH